MTTCASLWSRGCGPTAAPLQRHALPPSAWALSAPPTPGGQAGKGSALVCAGRAAGAAQAASHRFCPALLPTRSALVKVGSTTALAGVKCEVVPALPEAPDAGRLVVQVGIASDGTAACWAARSELACEYRGIHAARCVPHKRVLPLAPPFMHRWRWRRCAQPPRGPAGQPRRRRC